MALNGHRGEDSGLIPTGNTLITYSKDADTGAVKRSLENSGMGKVALSSDFETGPESIDSVLDDAPAYLIEGFNVAIVRRAESEATDIMRSLGEGSRTAGILEQRPEYFMFTQQHVEERYLAWLKEGAAMLARGGDIAARYQPDDDEEGALALFNDTATHTWGVQAVRAHVSFATGLGIKVAVLDTGVDLGHPDFAGRIVHAQSFVPGESVQDGHGHGTHCIGTACGPFHPAGVRRYGVAHKSSIIAIKVLSNAGSGQEGWILQGMQRAVQLGAQVISMSLGRPRIPTDPSAAYTNAGTFALANKCIIVAAAGNQAGLPVNAPANSPTIMAIAAVDSNLQPAAFSSVGGMPNGGEINVSGPGVNVFSSFPVAKGKYATLSGTSMATPHVAGCAALWAQLNPQTRGQALWSRLEQTARPLAHPATRVGRGLARSPVRIFMPPKLPIPHDGEEDVEDEVAAADTNGHGKAGRRKS